MKSLIVFCALLATASAQTFTVTFADTTLFSSAKPSDVVAAGLLTNTSSSTINLLATRVVNVSDTSWTTSVCMAVCMSPFVDTSGSYGIAPGGTQVFLLHFAPSSTPGRGDVQMAFADMAHPEYIVKQWFHLTTGGSTQFVSPTSSSIIYFAEVDTLRWSTTLTGNAAFTLSGDGGDTWTTIAASVPLSDGQYIWTPDPAFVSNAKLRLQTSQGSLISDATKITGRFYNPVAGKSLKSGAPATISWTPGVSGAAEFDYSVDNGSWKKVTSSVDMMSGQYVWTPAATMNSTNVRVRVKSSTWIMPSDVFTVSPNVSVGENAPTESALNISPNPANSTVHFTSNSKDIQRISVVDMLGRMVAVNLATAANPCTVDVTRLPAGLYLARIATNGSITSLPFTVIH